MRRPGAELLTARFERRGNKARIILDALDANDEFINGLALAANLRAPGQEQLNFALQQSAPGRYVGEFELTGAGRYYLNVTSSNDDGIAPATFGYAIPYSPEFASLSTEVDALRTIATRTGGEVLAMQPDELEKLLAPKEQAHPVGERVGWPLVLATVILLVLEVLVRRVPSPDWLRMWLAERFGKRSSMREVEPAYEALLASIEKSRRAHLTRLGEGRIIGRMILRHGRDFISVALQHLSQRQLNMLDVQPLSASLGAAVDGIQLTGRSNNEQMASILTALDEYGVCSFAVNRCPLLRCVT